MKKLLSSLALLLVLVPSPLFAKETLSARAIIALANQDRTAQGAGTLLQDPLLTLAAQKKADDMARRGYFSHMDPQGQTPWHWLTSVGYYYTRAGENLAINFDNAQSLQNAWMRSPGHRDNILKSGYTRVGIGIARGTYRGSPATFIVEFLATPAPTRSVARR